MKVIGYVRVSTEEQANSGLGLEAQIKKIKGYCDLYELELVDIVKDEGLSGKTLNREGLQSILSILKTDKTIGGIVVSKLDRLTRNVSDMGYLANKIFNTKQLFSVSEQVDTRTAGGNLVLNILISVAQWERETISERTKDALTSKKARGEKTGGYVPFGYEESNGKLIENQKEQEVISLMKKLREEGNSYRAIVEELNLNEIKTKNGKSWSITLVKRITDKE